MAPNVDAAGRGVVSHAGAVALARTAQANGLTTALSRAPLIMTIAGRHGIVDALDGPGRATLRGRTGG